MKEGIDIFRKIAYTVGVWQDKVASGFFVRCLTSEYTQAVMMFVLKSTALSYQKAAAAYVLPDEASEL